MPRGGEGGMWVFRKVIYTALYPPTPKQLHALAGPQLGLASQIGLSRVVPPTTPNSLDSNHWRPGIKPFTSQPALCAPSFFSSAHIPACSDRGRSHAHPSVCTYRPLHPDCPLHPLPSLVNSGPFRSAFSGSVYQLHPRPHFFSCPPTRNQCV